MTYSIPVILRECLPITDTSEVMDEGVKLVIENWYDLSEKCGGVPMWSTDFAMQNAGVISRTVMYDSSGDEIDMAMIGDQCREFIGLEKSKGLLKDLMPDVNISDIVNRINVCTEQRAPNYCLKSMSWNHGKDFLKYEVAFLPFLRNDGVEPTWFFSTLAFHFDEHICP